MIHFIQKFEYLQVALNCIVQLPRSVKKKEDIKWQHNRSFAHANSMNNMF